MLHEVEHKEAFIKGWYGFLKDGGKYLLVEPKIHTSQKLFDEEVEDRDLEALFSVEVKLDIMNLPLMECAP